MRGHKQLQGPRVREEALVVHGHDNRVDLLPHTRVSSRPGAAPRPQRVVGRSLPSRP